MYIVAVGYICEIIIATVSSSCYYLNAKSAIKMSQSCQGDLCVSIR